MGGNVSSGCLAVPDILKFQFIALFNCTVGNAVLGVPSEIPLDGQIFCIFLHQSAKMLRFALGTLRTAFPMGLHGNRAINCNLQLRQGGKFGILSEKRGDTHEM